MQTLWRGCRGNDVKTLQRILHLYEDGIFGNVTKEAVEDFQRANGLTPDGIVGIRTWAALSKVTQEMNLSKSTRNIKEIIIHCSATVEGKDYTVEDIKHWHIQQGYSTIGYHYLVYRDGSVHEGRNVNVIGAHCFGHNTYSIGVCYIGGVDKDGKTPKDTRTPQQKESLKKLLKNLKAIYPQSKIYGHRDFTNLKGCPSFDAKTEYKNT